MKFPFHQFIPLQHPSPMKTPALRGGFCRGINELVKISFRHQPIQMQMSLSFILVYSSCFTASRLRTPCFTTVHQYKLNFAPGQFNARRRSINHFGQNVHHPWCCKLLRVECIDSPNEVVKVGRFTFPKKSSQQKKRFTIVDCYDFEITNINQCPIN